MNRALTMTGALPGVNGDLQMVECEVYDDDDERAQPWRLSCTPEASFLMDFHSHLCRHEIIGFLGGTWDPEPNRCLKGRYRRGGWCWERRASKRGLSWIRACGHRGRWIRTG